MTLPSGSRGEFSLTGALVAMVMFIGVLGATLTVYEQFATASSDVTTRNDQQDQAREASDRIARALRNLASPTPQQPDAVDKAAPYDLVFKTVDAVGPNAGLNSANVKRVRYCVDATGNLWEQVQTWTTLTPPSVPSTASCPSAGWTVTNRMIAHNIVNLSEGAGAPLFAYDSTTLSAISAIDLDIWIDDDITADPPAARLQTGVFLRNQNRRPVAAFSATKSAQGIVLNGSASYDPEGEPLEYVWYDSGTKIGSGVVFTYKVTAGTEHHLSLAVFDPSGLEGDAPDQEVTA